MTTLGKSACLMAALFLVLAFASSALAQPVHSQPASALFFPVFDSGTNTDTLITVTNTNSSLLACGNGFRSGDVNVHYVYFNSVDCNEFDRTESLTPGDTLTLLASNHNPETEEGFLWVEAQDPETGSAIAYNFLIGSAHIVKTGGGAADGDFLWAYTPYGFVSTAGGPVTGCGFATTDIDGGNDADFDGIEYPFFPDRLFLDNFFAEDGVDIDLDNRIYLMVADRGITDTSLLVWDNNENRFSVGTQFDCWFGDALQSISLLFLEENLDDNAAPELVLAGGSQIFTGWMEVIPETSPLLGAFYTVKQNTDLGAGRELQYTGTFDADDDGVGDPVNFPRFVF